MFILALGIFLSILPLFTESPINKILIKKILLLSMRFTFKRWFQNKKKQNLFGIKLSNMRIIKENKERKNMESIEIKEELILLQVQSQKMMTIQINILMKVQRYFGMNNC